MVKLLQFLTLLVAIFTCLTKLADKISVAKLLTYGQLLPLCWQLVAFYRFYR